jgi:pimeloyl-ACP methyl ester carboxylesterase
MNLVKNLFRLSMLLLLATAVMVLVTPSLTLNSMLYPVRVDSTFLAQEEINYEMMLEKGKADSGKVFLYSPAGLRLRYMDISHKTPDSTRLSGWLTIDTTRQKAPLLLIIPDIHQGAIQYISSMKQFTDRGFHVCVMDMRAQGRSEGTVYHPGYAATDVISLIHELKTLPFIDKAAILGVGTGAGIAVAAVSISPFIVDALVLQNPPTALDELIMKNSLNEWGWIIGPLLPSIVRAYEQQTGIKTGDMNFGKLLSEMSIPQMYVAANHSSNRVVNETTAMYRSSGYFRKRLLIDKSTFQVPPGLENSKAYYDKISAFINSSLPGKFRRAKARKLAQVNEIRNFGH